MGYIVAYLMIILVGLSTLIISNIQGITPLWMQESGILSYCMLVGGVGGTIYCIRGVYVNKCVHKRWSSDWHIWYYLRPIMSLVMGGVSWLFLKAGLLVLDASQKSDNANFGFLALAFVAGYNVDNFLKKIEEIAEATWGITKSHRNKSN